MSKRHVMELKQVYAAILEDAAYAYPTLRGEFEKDLSRLWGTLEARGLHYSCVDLPALGKHLDRCLADGEYKPSGLPCSTGYAPGVVIPKFLRGLYLLVFESSGILKEDYDVQAIFFLRQVLYPAKKAKLACSDKDILDEIEEFYITDAILPEPEGFWDSQSATGSELNQLYQGFHTSELIKDRSSVLYPHDAELSVLLSNLDKVSRLVTTSLGAYMPSDWRCRHGPGAISEKSGPLINKYKWSNWSDRLETVFPIADYGYYNHSSWACNIISDRIGSNDPSSRLIDVPKTYSKPRLIAAEPSEHQWCQQNIWHYFCDRSRVSWISKFVRFNDQTLNQELCLRASVDGSLATVDLSAASDRVTCHVVGQMFRVNPGLLCALQATRTRWVSQVRHRHVPTEIPLRKFSTMGSACTFPVESLIFLSVALAAVLTQRRMRVTVRSILTLIGEVAVFGDDLIVPSDSRELLQKALEVLYFKVNDTKSFWTGKFRESCGVDAYAGVDVTPVYWRSPCNNDPESIASTVAVRNNFYQKFLLSTAAYLASTVRTGMIPYVSLDSGILGFKSRVEPIVANYQRYNKHLHRMETRISRLTSRQKRTPIEDDSAIFQYFTERPEPHTMWSGGLLQRPALRMKAVWEASRLLGFPIE